MNTPKLEHLQLKVMDWDIHVATVGLGAPVVLYHGLGASWEWWTPTIDDLMFQYRLYSVDLPGAGDSDPLTFQPTGDQFAEFTHGLAKALGLSSMALIGHSLGGYVALQSAIRGAANIERLALIAPGGVAPVGQPLLRMLRLPLVGELSQARYSRIGLKLMIDNITHTNDTAMIEQMVEWGSRSMKDAKNRKQFLYQLRLSSDIESVADIMNDRSPMVDSSTTRIFWGRHDPIFPVMAAFELQQMLNCAPPIIFENSGHLPQIEEQDTFNQALEQFLTGDAVTSHEHSLDF